MICLEFISVGKEDCRKVMRVMFSPVFVILSTGDHTPFHHISRNDSLHGTTPLLVPHPTTCRANPTSRTTKAYSTLHTGILTCSCCCCGCFLCSVRWVRSETVMLHTLCSVFISMCYSVHRGRCIPACTWQGICVSQNALG